MVNGGEGREELGKILLDLDHACSGLLFLLLFFQIFRARLRLGDAK
jgi:hypothetical protein